MRELPLAPPRDGPAPSPARSAGSSSRTEPEDLFRVIAASLPALVSYIGADYRYRFANRCYEAWLHQRPEEIAGRRVREVLGDAAWQAVRPHMERALAGHHVTYEDELPYRGGGPRWVRVSYTPDRSASGEVRGFVVLVSEITEQKRAEQRVEALTDDLRARIEELHGEHQRKDEFIAMLAHELRDPLAPIQNATTLLRLDGPEDARLAPIRGILERQVSQLTRLVDDLLDVSRIDRGKIELRRERTDVADVVQVALETAHPLIERLGHRIDVVLPRERLFVDADPTRLAQAISNLLHNAAKYTDPGGHLELAVGSEAGEVVLRVRDDGIGIAPEALPFVFDMFAQVQEGADRCRGGLGIGLSVVRRLVEMHGGRVEARSEGTGCGAEFTLRLPACAAPEPAGERDAPGHAVPERLRVLIADDNVDAAETLAALLRVLGQDVETVFDGRSALAAALRRPPDVVFLDLGMPGLSGYDVARALRERPGLARPLLVALTGWGEAEARRRTREAGFDEHLVKPPGLRALQELLARASERHPGISAVAPAS